MIPLFKSNFSIGKSILRLDKASYEAKDSSNIYYLAVNSGLKDLVMVEDSMTGFLECHKNCQELNLNLIFGLRLTLWENNFSHKLIVFAKNKSGCQDLNLLSTKYNTCEKKSFNIEDLKNNWSKNFLLYVPFYDSFLYTNLVSFSNLNPRLDFCDSIFFIEDNGLPFDKIMQDKVAEYCSANELNSLKSKSIYYNRKKDFIAYQAYKCICGRSFSKSITLDKPNLDHCSSDEFSFESYLEHESS